MMLKILIPGQMTSFEKNWVLLSNEPSRILRELQNEQPIIRQSLKDDFDIVGFIYYIVNFKKIADWSLIGHHL